MATTVQARSWFSAMLRERSFQIALVLWIVANSAVFALSGGKAPLNRPVLASFSVTFQVIATDVALAT